MTQFENKGNLEWFDEVYENWYKYLLKFGIKKTGCRQDAEDFIQDAAVKSLEKGDSLKKDGAISYFTTTMQLNTISRSKRRKSNKKKETLNFKNKEIEYNTSLDRLLEKEELKEELFNKQLLYAAIKTLPDSYQIAINSYLQEQFPEDPYAARRAKTFLYKALKNKIKGYNLK